MGALQGPGQVLVHAVFTAVEESSISQSDKIRRTNIVQAFSKSFSCGPFNSFHVNPPRLETGDTELSS